MTKTVAQEGSVAATITPGERQALLRLVKNDFEQVRAELEIQKNQWLRQEHERIDAEYAVARKAIRDYEKAAKAYAEKAKAQLQSLWEKHLAEHGVKRDRYDTFRVEFPSASEPPSLATAKRDAGSKAQQALSNALVALKREQLTAERTLLVSAVESSEAKQVLESLPKAADAFNNALASVPLALAS